MNVYIIIAVAIILSVALIYHGLKNSVELEEIEKDIDKNIEENIDNNQYVSEKMNELSKETIVEKPKRKYYKKKTNVTKKAPIKKSKPVK